MSAVRLERLAFTTSRLAEFVGKKELIAQTGQQPADWPTLILKELADNALDECEEAGRAPIISVEVDTGLGTITIIDNGRGIPAKTVETMLDYSVRVSSREAYVSPTRGAQGNALKTIVAMPFALDEANGTNARGVTIIEACGLRHTITFGMDAVSREPRVSREIGASIVKTGTQITIHWPESAWSLLAAGRLRFLQLASGFIFLNPHLSLSVIWDGEVEVDFRRFTVDPSFGERKWKPSDPTSAHWYSADQFSRYIAAHINRARQTGDRGRTVREFIGELRGITSTARASLIRLEALPPNTGAGAERVWLDPFFDEGRNTDGVARLLAACQEHTKPVPPKALGFIGKDNMRARLLSAGAEEGSLKYRRKDLIDESGLPCIIETAFGYCPDACIRKIVLGVNWSPAIGDPFQSRRKFVVDPGRAVCRLQPANCICRTPCHAARAVCRSRQIRIAVKHRRGRRAQGRSPNGHQGLVCSAPARDQRR
jgi:hypothetical protein